MYQYELVSLSDPEHVAPCTRVRRLRCHPAFSPRRILLVAAASLLLLVFAILSSGLPPSYKTLRAYERSLSKHNIATAHHPRFLRFPDHMWGNGFNNILQEALAQSHLAYTVGRMYVFEDYTWSHLPFPATLYDFSLRPATVPLNAFIAGPTAGGPMAALRAVGAAAYEEICYKDRTSVISIRGDEAPRNLDGADIVKWWTKRLEGVEEDCVEITGDVYEIQFFSGSRLLSLWPLLAKSPILTAFEWSPLVLSAIMRNFALFKEDSPHSDYAASTPELDQALHANITLSSGPNTPFPVLPNLIAVHLRRGDYKRHCKRLAGWGLSYMGFNLLPDLPDTFDTEAAAGDREIYRKHCLPNVDEIVLRLKQVRKEYQGERLQRVYLLTNGWGWWVSRLKRALEADGWGDVVTTGDLVLDNEQRWVDGAVDMAIAERAEVFVGNGFSSLSANIVMLRVAKGINILTNRFL